MYDKTIRRRRAVLAVLVGFSLILLTAYFGEAAGGPLHAVQRGVLEVFAPIGEGANRALKPFRDLTGWFGDTLHAKKQRDSLRKQVDYWRGKAVASQAALRENRQLRAMVGLGQAGLSGYKPQTARVIYRSPSLWYATIEVNEGSSSGVRVDQPVVNGQGLVGKVTQVTGDAAQVTLITDHTSGVSAELNNTGNTGLVQTAVGNPNDLLLDFLAKGADINKGDQVVTAGSKSTRLESLFPPGIPIGTVTRVDPEEVNLDQRVHIKPFASLRNLDFVQILTRPNARTASGLQARVP